MMQSQNIQKEKTRKIKQKIGKSYLTDEKSKRHNWV